MEELGEGEEDPRLEQMQLLMSSSSIMHSSFPSPGSWIFENYLKSNYDEIITR